MTNQHSLIARLKRPKSLVFAAQRVAQDAHNARNSAAHESQFAMAQAHLNHLVDQESRLNESRKLRSANYVPSQHVSVLAQLIRQLSSLSAAV